jgi:hypothetical protein
MGGSGSDAVDIGGRGVGDAMRLEVLFRLDARVRCGYILRSID